MENLSTFELCFTVVYSTLPHQDSGIEMMMCIVLFVITAGYSAMSREKLSRGGVVMCSGEVIGSCICIEVLVIGSALSILTGTLHEIRQVNNEWSRDPAAVTVGTGSMDQSQKSHVVAP